MTSTEILEVLSHNSSPNEPKRVGWMGIALAGATGGAAVLLSVIAAPFVVPALRKVSSKDYYITGRANVISCAVGLR